MTIHADMTYEFEGPTGLVIIPNGTKEAIHALIDKAILELPEAERPLAENERNVFYGHIIGYFSEYGALPDFSLKKRSDAP